MKHLLRQGWRRLAAYFAKQPLDRDLSEEMASHLEFAIEENMERGLSRPEARRQALLRFGNIAQAQDRHREARGLPAMDKLMQDLKYTFRTIRRDWSFTLIAVLILAIGIGANVAVFSVVNTLVLRPLPFSQPEQLVRILQKDPKGGESSMTYSVDAVQEFQRRTQTFQQVTGYFAFSGPGNLRLTGTGQPQPITGMMVAGNFFSTLGVKPVLGRQFTPQECLPNTGVVTMLSYAFWKSKFGGDPGIVGKSINVESLPFTIIGVLPESFDFGSVFAPGRKVDLYYPAIFGNMEDWGNSLALVGRLKPGVTMAQAQSEADGLFPKLIRNAKHANWGGGYDARLYGLKDYVSGKLHRSLIALWCAVGMILLIVCVNLSNLLLAKAATRRKEFALRSALGAGRGRLIRQLITESLILSSTGALFGLAFAFAVLSWLSQQSSVALPLLSNVRLDAATLGWTVLVTVVTGLIFGLIPAFRISTGNLHEALKDASPGMSEGRGHNRIRTILVISEVALACVLLVGSGLLLRSFLKVMDVDLGFQPSQAAAIKVDYDDGGKSEKRGPILRQMLSRVSQIPGVETAGITDNLPMSVNRSWNIEAKGHTYRKGELPDTFVYVVSPGYLNAIGIHLVRGRDIAWEDNDPKQAVVIINETVARYLWPGQDPIGQIAIVGGDEARVIGVIEDVHETSVETAAGWQMYLSETAPQYGPVGANLVVRSKLPPSALAADVMHVLRELNPGQTANEYRPIQQFVDHATSPRRFFMILVVTFAAIGLLLASLGIYGVISYSVTQQTKDIGIRMALGASASGVQRGVLFSTLRLTVAGIAAGTVLSLGLSRSIASMLFGTDPNDPATFAAMVLLLGMVALLAGYLPARRASRIDPMVALRNG
jgi:predicted permease